MRFFMSDLCFFRSIVFTSLFAVTLSKVLSVFTCVDFIKLSYYGTVFVNYCLFYVLAISSVVFPVFVRLVVPDVIYAR